MVHQIRLLFSTFCSVSFFIADIIIPCSFMYFQASFVSTDLGAITEATKKSGKVKIASDNIGRIVKIFNEKEFVLKIVAHA